MIKSLFTLRSAAVGLTVAAVGAAPAQARAIASRAIVRPTPARPASPRPAASPVDTSACAQLAFSQPFAPFGDYGYYTLVPGESVDNFVGTGWTFSGGAGLVQTRLRDRSTGLVLNLPGGSSATSPLMCVSSNYPTARTMIRDVRGSSGVRFYVSYAGSRSWTKPRTTGLVHGNAAAWTLSHSFGVQPSRRTVGWQIVRFRLAVPKRLGDYELYNLYVDPHMLH
jgi:hypothetical protein